MLTHETSTFREGLNQETAQIEDKLTVFIFNSLTCPVIFMYSDFVSVSVIKV